MKRQAAKEVGEILGRNKGKAIDFKYGKYYSTENELLERAGGLIFDRGAGREGLAHWQVPGPWRPTPELESTFLTVWQN